MIVSRGKRITLGAVVTASFALAALTGCAPAVPLGTGPGTTPSAGASTSAGSPSGSGQNASCDEFTSSAFSSLTTAKIGTPLVAAAGSGNTIACWYGIGSNSGVSGSAVEQLTSDNILVSIIGVAGPEQFKEDTSSDVNLGAVTGIDGIGDKAAYNTSALSGNVPQLYAYKGNTYCHIQMDASPSELVDQSQAAIAKDEGALCEDAFNR
jgi:hypothetical protein